MPPSWVLASTSLGMSKRLREMRESESERHREIERGGREGGRARERVKGREGDLSSGA